VVEGSSVSAILKAFDRQREPTIHISLLSKVVIENFSSENLICEIRGSEETFTHMFRLDQGKKEFLRENIIGNYMSIRLAVLRDAQVITALPEWSLQVILNRSEIGSMKECFASLLDTDQRLVKAFNVLLKNPSTEQLQICIYPRIVVRNICVSIPRMLN
jgi:DNA polymerase III sliding clamp (beta) subunit (PCNA family)